MDFVTMLMEVQDGDAARSVNVKLHELLDAIRNTAGKGTLTQIRISVFEGQPPITVTARIRYRINGGHLTVWYDLLHVERHVREAFALVSNEIELQGISVFQGVVE
jgi:ribosomal protein S28E/S33